jgi:hypothetical protein
MQTQRFWLSENESRGRAHIPPYTPKCVPPRMPYICPHEKFSKKCLLRMITDNKHRNRIFRIRIREKKRTRKEQEKGLIKKKSRAKEKI